MSSPPPPDFSKLIDELRKMVKRFTTSGRFFASPGSRPRSSTLPRANLVPAFMIILTGGAAYTLYQSMFFVPGGQRAIKFNAITGLYNRSFGEGAHIAIPYLETPIFFDARAKPTEVITTTGSRDLQLVNVSVRVLFRPSSKSLPELYRTLGSRYAETVLPSVINEVIKAVVAQYNASELLTRRAEVSRQIAASLMQRSASFHIEISDVAITNMTFGKEYTAAIEAKQIAQQLAERAKFQVDQAIQEKRGTIVLAEGEAESARLIGEAVQSQPGFLEMRRMEAARTISKLIHNRTSNNKIVLDADVLVMNNVLKSRGKG